MSTHPRRLTVLLPRLGAYLGCGALVLIEVGAINGSVLLYLIWLLALPGLTWLTLSPLGCRLLALAENLLVPLGALALGLPGSLVAAMGFVLILGHGSVAGARQAGVAAVTVGAPLAAVAWSAPWFEWRGSVPGEALALLLILGFALAAALLSHRQKTMLEAAQIELAGRAEQHAALAARLARYLPPAVHRVAFEQPGGTVKASHRCWLTVCFADLAGFTALTDAAESEDVVAMLDDFYTAMAEAALNYGGTLDKFIGDAVMVFFGEPGGRGRSRDAEDCMRMAAEMQERFAALRQRWLASGLSRDLGLRIGIHSGWCTLGSFGKGARMDYTVIGATVNAASRLESAAQPGQVLVSRATRALLGVEAERCRRLPPVLAKGFAQPIEGFEYRFRHARRKPRRWQGEGFELQLDPTAVDAGQVRKALAEASSFLEVSADGSAPERGAMLAMSVSVS